MPAGSRTAAIALMFACGCGPNPGIQERLRQSDYQMPYAERLRFDSSAPLVVLGRVLSVTNVGRPHPSHVDPLIEVQLTRIWIDIEEVIKGNAETGPAAFYYYAVSSTKELIPPHIYLPVVGGHRIFFLDRVGATLRSVGDVFDHTLRVFTGTHPQGFCRSKEPRCCIADILLTPGRDFDRKWFPIFLGDAYYAAGVLCCKGVATRLLYALALNSDQGVATAARDIFWAESLETQLPRRRPIE